MSENNDVTCDMESHFNSDVKGDTLANLNVIMKLGLCIPFFRLASDFTFHVNTIKGELTCWAS